jgi:quercetin dioxygenase-like cupin family protein
MEAAMKKLFISAALIALTGAAFAQHSMAPITPDSLKWAAAPGFPPGAQSVVLSGDPTKPGELYVTRLKLPANYQIPPHTHPYSTQILTVMSGSFGLGMGEKLEKKGELSKAGTVLEHNGKSPHYVWTGPEETIIQAVGIGPGVGIEYVNPADDPRKK